MLLCVAVAYAQTSLYIGDFKIPSQISPCYFGPNAFPVPDMLDGTTRDKLRMELESDYFSGFQGDGTTDITLRMTVPVFTERVNVSAWMTLVEWWNYSEERLHTCRLYDPVLLTGSVYGDLYVSADIWVLQARKHWLDLSVRGAVKTATGGKYWAARYYDCPGYFFDASFAKALEFHDSFFEELRFVLTGGFLCWQTNNARQNDAVMYGAALKLRAGFFTLQESFGGYVGWEANESVAPEIYPGDSPMSLKTDLTFHYRNWELLLRHQYGFRDWPFHQFRIGLAYNIDMLPKSRRMTPKSRSCGTSRSSSVRYAVARQGN